MVLVIKVQGFQAWLYPGVHLDLVISLATGFTFFCVDVPLKLVLSMCCSSPHCARLHSLSSATTVGRKLLLQSVPAKAPRMGLIDPPGPHAHPELREVLFRDTLQQEREGRSLP